MTTTDCSITYIIKMQELGFGLRVEIVTKPALQLAEEVGSENFPKKVSTITGGGHN